MSKGAKIEHLKGLIAHSEAVRSNLDLPAARWEEVLHTLSDEQINELLLMLKEESEMVSDIGHEKKRKHAMNEGNYVRQLERMKLRSENLTDNQGQ